MDHTYQEPFIDEDSTNEKMQRLIRRLLEKRVIPFLGAGVSYSAKTDNGESLAVTQKLVCDLRNILENQYQHSMSRPWPQWAYHTASTFENSLSVLCELFVWLTDNPAALLRVLNIPRFVDLRPTAAHRYIAFLAREGLIEEVITTNYDTCMEKAYRETFGDPPAPDPPCLSARNPQDSDPHDDDDLLVKLYDPCLVITNLHQYRKWSGKTFLEQNLVPRRSLRVYKINGCACRYRYLSDKGSDEMESRNAAESILLTERQLQNWRERHWARDLFRDRLRSRTLLFSGFGSPEPQVSHTVMQIVEEFERVSNQDPGAGSSSSHRWFALPNAPFVVAYDADLSFHQVQILYSYARAHYHHNQCVPLGNGIDPLANAITGTSAPFFQGDTGDDQIPCNQSENRLPADLFWTRLYQMTFYRLLRNKCLRGTPAYACLAPFVGDADLLFAEMLNWYDPDNEKHPFGRFPSLLEILESHGVTLFSRWIWAIRYGSGHPSTGWYAPLEEYPVLIPSVLLILFLLFQPHHPADEDWLDHILCDEGFFAVLPTGSNGARSEWVVSIAHENALQTQGSHQRNSTYLSNCRRNRSRGNQGCKKKGGRRSQERWEIITGDKRPLTALSTGQQAQMGISLLLSLNLALEDYLHHHVIALDDTTSAFDTAHLPRQAALIRRLAYGLHGDDPFPRRQIFIVSHHEKLTQRLLEYLTPPEGRTMKVLHFSDWSPEDGPAVEEWDAVPALPISPETRQRWEDLLSASLISQLQSF